MLNSGFLSLREINSKGFIADGSYVTYDSLAFIMEQVSGIMVPARIPFVNPDEENMQVITAVTQELVTVPHKSILDFMMWYHEASMRVDGTFSTIQMLCATKKLKISRNRKLKLMCHGKTINNDSMTMEKKTTP